jgi:hypothetical protein
MSYYHKNLLYDEYLQLFLDEIGTEPTAKEKKFLKSYFDPHNSDGAKLIYYMAIFRLKRGWYKFFVYFLIARTLKKAFKKDETLDALVKLHKVFAKKMLNDAIKAYCKIND